MRRMVSETHSPWAFWKTLAICKYTCVHECTHMCLHTHVPQHRENTGRVRVNVSDSESVKDQQRRARGLEIQMTRQHKLFQKSKLQNTFKMKGSQNINKLRGNVQSLNKAE